MTFAAGEAYQFDWSEEEVEIGGVVQRVKAAHFRLTHSRQPFVMVFPRETQEMVFAAHDAAFHYWGGVPRQGIYDNLKTCIDQVLEGKERRFNPRFLALMSHYVIEPVACTPASGWEKGQVEKQVQDVRRRCFTPRRKVDSLAELNRRLIQELEQAAQTRPHPDDPRKQCGSASSRNGPPCAPWLRASMAMWSGSCGLTAPASSTSTATPTVSTAVTPIVMSQPGSSLTGSRCMPRASLLPSIPASLAGMHIPVENEHLFRLKMNADSGLLVHRFRTPQCTYSDAR
ncbi:IS21 family transposase [Aeromonas sanarellii]|nr:IS21 family transposase [Aeromonas sanarellii]